MPFVQILRDLGGRYLSRRATRQRRSSHPKPGNYRVSRRMSGRVMALLSGLLLVMLSGCSLIEDSLNLVPKPPSTEIQRLALGTTMTPLAQRLFYRQQPTVEPPNVFWEHCKVPHGLIVLGCYVEEQQGLRGKKSKIVIQNVVDHRFSGTMEVTAAHEMLHAAYARLEPEEQAELFQQLHAARDRVKDQRLLALLKDYESQSQERYAHELYAHLGTELADLGNPALEAHYQQFFGDRQQVVALATKSTAVVAELNQKADALEVEINQLEKQLTAAQANLVKGEARLDQLSASLEQQEAELHEADSATYYVASSLAKDKSNEAKAKRKQLAFNRQATSYNLKVKQHKKNVARFNQMVQDYQQKVNAYNQLAWRRQKTMEGLASQAPTKARRLRQPI